MPRKSRGVLVAGNVVPGPAWLSRAVGARYVVEALALSRETGEPAAIADALLLLGHLEPAEGFPERRRHALAEEALIHARRAADPRLVAYALSDRAKALAPDEGERELEQAIAALREIGAARSLAMLYNGAAYNAIKADSTHRARAFLDQSESLARELDDQMVLAAVSGNAGLAALFAGQLNAAQRAFEQQLGICRRLVIPWLASEGLAGLAAIATRHGKLDRAAHILGAAAAHGPVGDAGVIARLERQYFAPARQRYGDQPWHQAHTAGGELAFADAIDFALDAVADPPERHYGLAPIVNSSDDDAQPQPHD